MAGLLNNRWVVAALALVAVYVVYQRVVVPIIGDDESAAVMADIDDDIDEVIDATDDPGIETVEQGLQFATAQYDLTSVSVDALKWNENPTRDPFAPRVVIDTADVTAVQGKITDVPAITASVPLPHSEPPAIAAIVSGSEIQYVVVDGDIIEPGQRIGQWRLVAVERDTAVFTAIAGRDTRRVRIRQ